MRIAYGPSSSQFGKLHVPAGAGPHPVVVLVHGGFWRDAYDLSLMDPLSADLVARGFATWNIEYRRLGEPGGGWPGTADDVAAAVDHLDDLANDHALDLDRVSVVGHSAGGHLALWLGTRDDATVAPAVVVGQAPVADLADAAQRALGGGVVSSFLGGDASNLGSASPIERLPAGVRTVLVHGGDDDIVPPNQSERYADAALRAGDEVELVVLNGTDHFDVIDPSHRSWLEVVDRLAS